MSDENKDLLTATIQDTTDDFFKRLKAAVDEENARREAGLPAPKLTLEEVIKQAPRPPRTWKTVLARIAMQIVPSVDADHSSEDRRNFINECLEEFQEFLKEFAEKDHQLWKAINYELLQCYEMSLFSHLMASWSYWLRQQHQAIGKVVTQADQFRYASPDKIEELFRGGSPAWSAMMGQLVAMETPEIERVRVSLRYVYRSLTDESMKDDFRCFYRFLQMAVLKQCQITWPAL